MYNIREELAKLSRDEINMILFTVMSHQIGVMAEWGDDDDALWNEIVEADEEILGEYVDFFLLP